ncbi:hypothetical protein VO54_01416 [Elizabethkingia miricola]|nr:hypothetical protein VO54_01416 [Elizabethkingia miricola]
MKKNLLNASLWGILTLSTLFSCRTDSVATEQTDQAKEKITAFERFEKDNNIIQLKASNKNDVSSEKYISYAAPFSEIITNFLEKHSDYRERLEKEIGRIRLEVSSTTFGEGAKGVLFPVTDKNGKVIGALGGIVNEERDYVKFYYLNNSSQEVTSIKNAFQSYYDRNTGSLSQLAIASKNSNINPVAKKDVTEIEEVVITVYKPLNYYDLPSWWHDAGWTNPNPGPGPGTTMDGGPGTHSGGGSNENNKDQQQDSCSKAKTRANSEKGRAAIKDLERKAKQPGSNEYAYRQDKDGTMTMYEGERDNVTFPLDNNIEGIYHNHQDLGVAMFSPRDIRTLLIISRMQSDESVGNTFVGMIPANGDNYFINFNGTKADIPVIYDSQLEQFSKDYDRIQMTMAMFSPKSQSGLSEKQLQKLFFDITDKMGLKGKVNLIKEKNGNTSSITRNADGTIADPKPC